MYNSDDIEEIEESYAQTVVRASKGKLRADSGSLSININYKVNLGNFFVS